MPKLCKDDNVFMHKINKGHVNMRMNIQTAYNQGILNLNDKKRCCLIVNGFGLEQMKSQSQWKVEGDDHFMKFQWFHSAVAIYMLLNHFVDKPKKSFVDSIFSSKTDETFTEISREVLLSDPDGIKMVELIDSKVQAIVIDYSNGGPHYFKSD